MDLQKTKISLLQLQQTIKQWLCSPQKDLIKKLVKKKFKYELQNIQNICSQIIQKAIQYCYLIKFSNTLKCGQQIKQKQIFLSSQLKQFYQKKNGSHEWKKEFQFQLTLIYMIQLISMFICDTLTFLKNNEALKSQIYLLLVHVFLGIEVGSKVYHLTSKRYFIKDQKQIKKKQMKSFSYQKKPSITMSDKQSLKAVNDFMKHHEKSRGLRKNRTRQKISMIQTQQKKSIFQNFTQNLKQNLLVDPLPPIQIKKMSIVQFDRFKTQDDQQIKKNMIKISQQMKRKHINSMTISTSLDVQLSKKGIFLQTKQYQKSSNLSFKSQHHSKHYHNLLNKKEFKYETLKTQIEFKPAKSKSKKIEPEEWKQILRRMKLNANKPIQQLKNQNHKSNKQNNQFQEMIEKKLKKTQQKHQRNIQNLNISLNMRQSIQMKLNHPFQYNQSSKTGITSQNQIFKPSKLLKGLLVMNSMSQTKTGKQNQEKELKKKLKEKFSEIKTENQQNYQSMLIKSGKLKLKKREFLNQCKNRSQKIQHSAFQLKNKLMI